MVIDIELKSFFPELEYGAADSQKKSSLPKYSADDLAVRCQSTEYKFDRKNLRTDCFRDNPDSKKKKH